MNAAARRLGGAAALAFAGMAIAAAPALGASNVIYQPSEGGSTFVVIGEPDDEQLSIAVDGNTITITDTGTGGIATADADCANPSLVTVTCPLDPPDSAPPAEPTAPVFGAGFDLQAGNDTLTSSGTFFMEVVAGAGDDVVNGGPDQDSIIGGEGNDQLFGGDGNDAFDGGTTGPASTGGSDLIDGQGGVDFAQYPRTSPVTVNLNDLPDDGFPGEGDNVITEEVFGGNKDDTLIGNSRANALFGQAGNDTISGLEGNDLLDGGAGDDALIGGPQRDQFFCDVNFDTAIVDPRDAPDPTCERTGAEVEDSTATVNKKSKAKVEVSCPLEEANQCDGTLVLLAGSKELGSAAFSVGAGFTGKATVKLNDDGRKLFDKNGGTLLGTAQAQTSEPIGVSVAEGDVLLERKSG